MTLWCVHVTVQEFSFHICIMNYIYNHDIMLNGTWQSITDTKSHSLNQESSRLLTSLKEGFKTSYKIHPSNNLLSSSWSNKNKKTNLHVCIQSMIYTLQKRNLNQNYVHLNNIHISDIKSSSVLLNSSCFDV